MFISTLAAGVLPKPSEPPANQVELLAASIQPIVAFMVLCSILIHGLSIPSFSLGKRVHSISHTWSRHAAPDWTTQARHVTRPEDIVINRDAEMEAGEVGKEKDEDEKGTPETQSETMMDSQESQVKPGKSEDGERNDDDSELKAQNHPDGDDIESEWREGPHKIIERKIEAGEEVMKSQTIRIVAILTTIDTRLKSKSSAISTPRTKTSLAQNSKDPRHM